MVPPNDKKAHHQSIRVQYVCDQIFFCFLQSASRSITINVLSIDYVTLTPGHSCHLGMYSIAKLYSGCGIQGSITIYKIALLNQKHFYDPSHHLLHSLSLHTVLFLLQHLSWGHSAIHSTIHTCCEVFMCDSKTFNCPTRSLGTYCGTSVFLYL